MSIQSKAYLLILACIVGAGIYFLQEPPKETIAGDQVAQVSAISPTPDANASATTTNQEQITQNNQESNKEKVMTKATLETNYGEIVIEFLPAQAPNTVANFIKLAGAGFYDGTRFHRVMKDFMIQGGDPLSKDEAQASRWGTGGPNYTFADEISASNHDVAGTIAMANAGPNTNGSQFFINTADNNYLDGKHTVFGKVTAGMDVVDAIQNVEVDDISSRPVKSVTIEKVVLQ
ncbi:MAG: peptidylprolyl isomerase [Candidatus Paceibacterota bacterium]|jgi:peptidylprolyl isomerase